MITTHNTVLSGVVGSLLSYFHKVLRAVIFYRARLVTESELREYSVGSSLQILDFDLIVSCS